MKKFLLALIIIILPIFAFTQNKTKTKDLGTITKTKLSEIKLHSEIIPMLLKDSKPFEIEITGKAGEILTQAKATSDKISEEENNFFKSVNPGTKLYFDVYYIEPTGKRVAAQTYVLKVTK
ncbi:MAG: hypothetical protein ACXVC7_04345 [Bacteroidia bacterium]